jgi:hypothetical protein
MSEFWSDLRGPDGQVRFGGVHGKRYRPLALGADAGYETLLAAEDGQAVLAIRRLGKGQVTVSGLAFAGRRGGAPEWSTLPRKKAFLVLAQPIALGAVSGMVHESMSLVAGNAPRSLPGKEAEVKIHTLVGDQVDWSGPRDQVPMLVREGAYIVRMGERKACLSVTPSDAEGNKAFVVGDEVPAVSGVAHVVRELSDEEDFRDELESSVAGMGLYVPLLLLAAIALMAEGLLGSPALRRKKRPAGEEDLEDRVQPGAAPAAASGGEEVS